MKLPAVQSTPHTDVSVFFHAIHSAVANTKKRDVIVRRLTYPLGESHRVAQAELIQSYTSSQHQQRKNDLLLVLQGWHRSYHKNTAMLSFKLSKTRSIQIQKAESVLHGPRVPLQPMHALSLASFAHRMSLQKKKTSVVLV
jgi:hypothetical protein